ncbi:MAG TPA: hypothetical protein VHY56_01510 [Candidatus Binataceae bacterium]|nr:hypothetical protein [Candidatus Binataceae bacterium]
MTGFKEVEAGTSWSALTNVVRGWRMWGWQGAGTFPAPNFHGVGRESGANE